MPHYSRNEIVLVRYPYSDLSATKVRPAVVINSPHPSEDIIVVALTSRTQRLLPGEFLLGDWREEGLNVPTAVKRGILTVSSSIVVCSVGKLSARDSARLRESVAGWIS